MRLGIISDVHGNIVALDAVLRDMKRHAPDVIINLGDCATSPLWPRETVERLAAERFPTVRGNHDRWLGERAGHEGSASVLFTAASLTAAQIAHLHDLPPAITLDGDVLAFHGSPAGDTSYLLEEKVDGRLRPVTAQQLAERIGPTDATLVLCGHSHHQHTAGAPGNRLVVNPGSVGCPRYADNDDPLAAEACSPHARYAVATRNSSGWSVDLCALAYDWGSVIERAIANGRPDWAAAFAGP